MFKKHNVNYDENLAGNNEIRTKQEALTTAQTRAGEGSKGTKMMTTMMFFVQTLIASDNDR